MQVTCISDIMGISHVIQSELLTVDALFVITILFHGIIILPAKFIGSLPNWPFIPDWLGNQNKFSFDFPYMQAVSR